VSRHAGVALAGFAAVALFSILPVAVIAAAARNRALAVAYASAAGLIAAGAVSAAVALW
jgi:hypothetical protein